MQYIKELLSKNLSLIVKKDSRIIFQSSGEMLHDLVACIKKHKKEMNNSIIIDKVVGLAAARLLVFARVKEVYAFIASEPAIKYLQKRNIAIHARTIVKNILNKDKTDICPMERRALNCKSDAEFYKSLSTYS